MRRLSVAPCAGRSSFYAWPITRATAILAAWLENKTPARVRSWIAGNPAGMFVAVLGGTVSGVADILPEGRVVLNYVAPWARFRGVTKSLLGAMESRAAQMGLDACTLTSTATAHRLYLACGYRDVGTPLASYGGKPAYPMRKALVQGWPAPPDAP